STVLIRNKEQSHVTVAITTGIVRMTVAVGLSRAMLRHHEPREPFPPRIHEVAVARDERHARYRVSNARIIPERSNDRGQMIAVVVPHGERNDHAAAVYSFLQRGQVPTKVPVVLSSLLHVAR